MPEPVVFKDKNGTAEFSCIDCGQRIVSFCHSDDRPVCALCRFLPGWRQGDDGKLIPPGDEK